MFALNGNPTSGPASLSLGLKLILHPELRLFILVPMIINVVLFFVVTAWLLSEFGLLMDGMMSYLPGWLSFLGSILWLFAAFLVIFVYGYSFSIITNLIAAPFNGILAEKIEEKLTGIAPPAEPLQQMIPRTLLRELLKLWYFISRGFLVLLLMFALAFIPLVNLLAPVIGVLWGAWCMSIQYVDYASDNHKTPFKSLRQQLGSQTLGSYSFGGLVMLGNMVPVLNIFVMPIAVAGATVFWLKDIQGKPLDPSRLLKP
ncbi:sulfate transporter CysZ [Simiduia curdlanivorans]|uniref:Sulfate transporter CysZ n=1 Tax=Simiduia curdlanivorans TaxID=1492769 RepID=A0ABV8V918_9GAMM|nr:sulfate transporter CysZ [Simiduia curdlanivorans]MDN3638901.1 sulfate transporter CysZ [Simiduia curdlanivorans]